MVWLKPVILQHENHFPSAEGAHVTTETICKAAQKKQVKTDGDRTLPLTTIDLLLERERKWGWFGQRLDWVFLDSVHRHWPNPVFPLRLPGSLSDTHTDSYRQVTQVRLCVSLVCSQSVVALSLQLLPSNHFQLQQFRVVVFLPQSDQKIISCCFMLRISSNTLL